MKIRRAKFAPLAQISNLTIFTSCTFVAILFAFAANVRAQNVEPEMIVAHVGCDGIVATVFNPPLDYSKDNLITGTLYDSNNGKIPFTLHFARYKDQSDIDLGVYAVFESFPDFHLRNGNHQYSVMSASGVGLEAANVPTESFWLSCTDNFNHPIFQEHRYLPLLMTP